MSVYLQEFKSREEIEDAYECEIPEGAEILLAYYGYGSYCGGSLVIYRLDGKLYEVNGAHCSCYGLEGQWNPEETTIAALRMRNLIDGDYDGADEANSKLVALLDWLDTDDRLEKRMMDSDSVLVFHPIGRTIYAKYSNISAEVLLETCKNLREDPMFAKARDTACDVAYLIETLSCQLTQMRDKVEAVSIIVEKYTKGNSDQYYRFANYTILLEELAEAIS